MCKFYAYGYPCRWERGGNECRSVHDEDVKKAFESFQEKVALVLDGVLTVKLPTLGHSSAVVK